MPDYRYLGIKVIQQPGAPAFYMTSAPAGELLEWCDVPRAKGDYMAGYQRTLQEKRVDDLAAYLRLSSNNIIPGAVIIAIDEDYVSVSEVSNNLFALEIAEDRRSFEDKLQELWGGFTTRLGNSELSSAGIDYSVPPSDTREASTPTDESEDSSDGPEEAIDADREEGYEEEEDLYPRSYLASLTQELTQAVTNWEDVSEKRQNAIRSYIQEVSKPGLIIDGQHRVFGAKNVSEHDVRLPVVLLPALTFSEQVFQFYVLNSKARPLKPTELRRIISTSLTDQEIEVLYERFKAAGIEAEEAQWTMRMNTDPSSPFRSRIAFGYGEQGAIIPENVADQVVRAFMKMPMNRYRQLIAPLGEQWTDTDKRLEIFFWFWNAIKDVYADTWKKAEAKADMGEKDQIFMKVALLTLQKFLLNRFVTALPYRSLGDAPPLSSQEEISRMVQQTLTNLPAEFFEREWKMKQIDTSEGRRQLARFMELVWDNQGKLHGNMALFRG
jgi:DGQHR domain-containing protein